MKVVIKNRSAQSKIMGKARWLIGASALVTGTAVMAAPPLTINNVAPPTIVGSGQGERAIWADGGEVGSTTVDIVGIITIASIDHRWSTTSSRPSIIANGQDDIFIEWRLYEAGTYDIATDSGGVPVTADIHVQFNDVDGPNNERLYMPVCQGEVKWIRMAIDATTGREFGTVSGVPEIFSLVGDRNYNNQPESGLEAFWPDSNTFSMGRTANNGYLIRLDNPTYSAFDTLDFECADFIPPNAVDDSQEGTPGASTIIEILENDTATTANNNPPNNNALQASEFANASVDLVAPAGATNIVTDAAGDTVSFTVPGEGDWSYNDLNGELTFTPDPSFVGSATTIDYTFDNALGIASNQATVIVWYPGMGIVKSSSFNDENSDGYAQVGETIDYVYEMKSYGVEPLRNITLSETTFTGAGTAPVPVYQSGDTNSDTFLGLTETWTYTASYTLVAADIAAGISNSATGTGETAAGTPVSDVSDSSNTTDGSPTSGPGPDNGDPTTNTPPSKPIDADDDSQSGIIYPAAGLANAYNVLDNDDLDGAAADFTNITLAVTAAASHAGVVLDPATGIVSVAPGTPAGTYTIDYEICEVGNPTNCANATASIVVTAPTAIGASDDNPADVPSTGGTNIINVLGNDDLGGSAPAIGDVTISVTTPAAPASSGASVPVLDPATGNVSVAAGTPAGTYAIVYEFCEDANGGNCATATVNVTVLAPPISASPDTPAAVNGAIGGNDIVNAFDNDTLNGAAVDPADIDATVTAAATPNNPGDPVPVLDPATGLVDVPAGTPAGTYTIAYEICETATPLNCANSTVTVVVQPAPIAAATDPAPDVAAGVGSANAINAFDNDTLSGVAIDPADITATVTTPATPASSGAAVPVLDPVTGIVSVANNVPAGAYTIAYEICEDLNPSNCANTTVTVNVVDAPIAASADVPAPVNGATGGDDIINAFANDTLNGAPVDPAEIDAAVTTSATPASPGDPVPVLDPATGLVDVPVGTPAGTYVIAYEICETANPSNCATSSVTVEVIPSPLIANDDSVLGINGAIGGDNVLNAFDGDTVNGIVAGPANSTLTLASGFTVPAQLTFDPATGDVDVVAGSLPGTYSFDYQICENLNPANCATATVSVEVVASPIAAAADAPAPVNGATGGDDIINAFANDTLNGAPVDLADIDASVTAPATPASPGDPVPVLDPATGLVDVPAGTPAGTYTIAYEICESLNPSNCADNVVTVVVSAAPIAAAPDMPAPVNGATGGDDIVNAYANDVLNGAPVDPADVTGTVITPAAPVNPGDPVPVLDPATGLVDVPAGTPAGTYTIAYEICESLNPSNCATSTVTVEVEAAPIAAEIDTPAPVIGASGGDDIINAYDNDTLSGNPVDPADITGTVIAPATPNNPGDPVPVLDPVTGLVDVPAGTPAGTYTIAYEICEDLNPSNCADSSITIVVEASPLIAIDDSATGINGLAGAPAVTNAFGDDSVNGVAASPANGTLSVAPASIVPAELTFDPASGDVAVLPNTPAGSYGFNYQLCENLNPSNCVIANITVDVAAAPIDAGADTPAPINGATGSPEVVNAFDNDTLNGVPVDPSDITGTVTAPATPLNPGDPVPELDPVTGVVSLPPATPAGTYVIAYEICEILNPSNCADSTVTIVVEASPLLASDDGATGINGLTGEDDAANVFDGDTLNGTPATPASTTISLAPGASVPAELTFDPATGNVDVLPNTPEGTYSFDYQICENLNPSNCAIANVSIDVAAAPIVAAPDTPAPVNGSDGGDDIINAFDNDTLNGGPVDPDDITATISTPATPASPGAPVPEMDPETGLVDVPPATPAGTYTIVYEICEDLNPDNCGTSSVTVEVEAPEIVADNDVSVPVRNGVGDPEAINVFENDTLNGDPINPDEITATVVTPPADPGIVLDPATGIVSVGPDVPPGDYTIVYQICENLNPDNCTTGTVSILVEDPRGSISGTVFTDENVDDEWEQGEDLREGWIVEVLLDDEVVAATTTDQQGNYELEDILSGEGYQILFTNPNNGVVYEVIDDVTVGVADTLEGQDLPIDPSGVIYDSVDRTPIAGAQVQLVDANGSPLSPSCFLDPSQANQVTGPLGEYQFDILPGSASQCPAGEAEYFIEITPPTGYATNSTVLAPSDGPLDPTGLGSPVLVNPEAGPPTTANPPYYLSVRLASGDPDVIFNHIPLDPFLDRNPLVVTKTSSKRTANIGDIVPYEITVRNAENVQRADVDVYDILPAGMKYVVGSSSVDGVAQEPEVANGNRELVWRDQIIPGNGSVRYNLMMIIGAGVTGGEKVNTGVAENGLDGQPISNRGTAVVQIVPSAVFDCSELLGKVFEDGNRNGYQDTDEPGVAGVRLATVNGQLITTDEYGRYHIACAAVPDARIGSNFVLKVDVRTLPLGWDTTTDNPRSIRLTRGKFGELNFGVAPKVEVRTRSRRRATGQEGQGE